VNRTCFSFIANPWIQNFIMGCIVLNVIAMMFDKYPPVQPPLKDISETASLVFTLVFAVECVIINIAIGPKAYWKNKLHVFDGFIVVTSMVELAFSGSGAMTSLRAFRLFRIFKLAKRWKSLQILLKAIVYTGLSMGNLNP
jgi:hypothetical protein